MAKVDVITCDEAEFGKWRWWSNWVDVAVYDYGYDGYLLQMRVSRTNKKKFRSVALSGSYINKANIKQTGNLTQMTKEQQND